MGTTEYNIDMIKRRASKETPEMIMAILDEIQTIVYSQNTFQTQKITSSGMPPFLETQEGVLEYDAPEDCRQTAAVFVSPKPRGYSRNTNIDRRDEYYFVSNRYLRVPIITRDATIDNPGKIYFQDDPGTTTDKYYHLYYIKPTPITDINIQLTLPEHVHYLLREAVISMITSDEYGKSGFDESIMEKVVKKIRIALNKGYGGCTGKTPIPEEYQEYDSGGIF